MSFNKQFETFKTSINAELANFQRQASEHITNIENACGQDNAKAGTEHAKALSELMQNSIGKVKELLNNVPAATDMEKLSESIDERIKTVGRMVMQSSRFTSLQ